MIKVTFEFLTVDAAIVALGKLSSAAPASVGPDKGFPPVKATANSGHALPPVAAEPKQRKPRSDQGQKRGPHKNAGEGGTNQVPPQAAPAPTPAPNVAAPSTPAAGGGTRELPPETTAPGKVGEKPANQTATTSDRPVAAAPTIEDAQAALAKVFEAHDLKTAQEVLSRSGVTRLRDLLPEQRAEFIKDAEAAVASKK